MGKIVVSTNMTLDGVVQDPDGAEGFEFGGWFARAGGADLEGWSSAMTDEAMTASALLLGRRSDEWFARRWTDRTGPWADRLNSLPKYVVSANAEAAAWTNATVLSGNAVNAVGNLKRDLDGEILTYASYQLTRALIEHDLIDELRLTVFPITLGAGHHLFDDLAGPKPLKLDAVNKIGGLVTLSYRLN
jgi:dihydrofolate reductase